ncbi:MAG: glycerol-3-phosphate dehydrogenase [Alphaproteobacteria bacterium]|nr:glycerol-3-phosphate dehydrogenase [Alphaproteobacteria bacterium]
MNGRHSYDLCVIGGGINGTGIARDAAGRGLSVLLIEQNDLASATSSASSKLIHGGLRYLEYGEFRLVREALQEREILFRNAPHLIQTRTFILPRAKEIRPAWMIRTGLFLYDHLARRKAFHGSRRIGRRESRYLEPLAESPQAFAYSDGWVDDSRLAVLNAVDAQERGATILTRTECTAIASGPENWSLTLLSKKTGQHFERTAKTVVNAAGPWVRHLLDQTGLSDEKTPQMRLVKGSHIIVPRLYEGNHCYILQQPDRRIVFALPYEQDFTLIGTTDTPFAFEQNPAKVAIDEQEKTYLLQAVNHSFKEKIDTDRILFSYSGVRPLLEDAAASARAVTRDYKIHKIQKDSLNLYSIFGGKITTYRHLAEDVVDRITKRPAWTARTPLPGGDIPACDMGAFIARQKNRYAWAPETLIVRTAYAYGTRMDAALNHAADMTGLGRTFGDDLYEAEIRYLIDREFACTTEDILWRRSKRGMHVNPKTVAALEEYLHRHPKPTDCS